MPPPLPHFYRSTMRCQRVCDAQNTRGCDAKGRVYKHEGCRFGIEDRSLKQDHDHPTSVHFLSSVVTKSYQEHNVTEELAICQRTASLLSNLRLCAQLSRCISYYCTALQKNIRSCNRRPPWRSGSFFPWSQIPWAPPVLSCPFHCRRAALCR